MVGHADTIWGAEVMGEQQHYEYEFEIPYPDGLNQIEFLVD